MKFICKKHGDQTGKTAIIRLNGRQERFCVECIFETLEREIGFIDEIEEVKK